jgi:heptosyltransferase-2
MTKQHLAIRLPNWLGDVIMTLPSLQALSSAGFTFDLFGKSWVKDLLAGHPYVCHTIPNKFSDIRRLYQSATSAKHAILFTNSLSSALQFTGLGIKTMGYYRSMVRRVVLHRAQQKPPGLHEIEYFWQLTQFSVQQPLLIPQNPKLIVTDRYQQQAEAICKQHAMEDFFVICPGATGHGKHGQSKVWPYWQQLCTHLQQKGIQMLACPAPSEAQQFTEILGPHVRILNQIDLPMYAAILQRAKQVIANDSGPMHLAAAVQAPVLGIFGQTDPQRTRPWGGKFIGKLNQWPECADVLTCLPV